MAMREIQKHWEIESSGFCNGLSVVGVGARAGQERLTDLPAAIESR